mgnify:CR=1 FL=1
MDRTSPLSTLDTRTQGWINGFIGVVIFSGSLPATRLAVMEFDPAFLTMIRAAIAAALGVLLLWLFKEKRPARNQWGPLVVVALGVVIGFPLLTALALQYVTSAHSIVFIGLLPLATAVFGVLRRKRMLDHLSNNGAARALLGCKIGTVSARIAASRDQFLDRQMGDAFVHAAAVDGGAQIADDYGCAARAQFLGVLAAHPAPCPGDQRAFHQYGGPKTAS